MPYLIKKYGLFEDSILKGSFEKLERPNFSYDEWFTTSYQQNCEKYANENFGLRNNCVRLNNQLRYDLFKKTSNREVAFGKDGYMFAWDYIEAFTGKNYIGIDSILKKALLLKELQIKLKQRGIMLVPVLAPNKARVLADKLPNEFKEGSLTNYSEFIKCFNRLKIDHVDFNEYFVKTHLKSKYPLYTKYGIHWSSYGCAMATDSILGYINSKSGIKTSRLIWKDNIELSDSLRDFDYDIGESLNLLGSQLPSEKMAYPHIRFTKVESEKPSLLVVGDSYFSVVETTHIQDSVFKDYRFLYYFREVRPYSSDAGAFLKLDIKKEIFDRKVVILILTEHNLVNYGFGFLERAVSIVNGGDESAVQKRSLDIVDMIEKIKTDKLWMDKIRVQAREKNKEMHEMIYLNAAYMVDQLNKQGMAK